MDKAVETSNEELERFRRQWREEVIAKSKGANSSQSTEKRPQLRKGSSAGQTSFHALKPVVTGSSSHGYDSEEENYEEELGKEAPQDLTNDTADSQSNSKAKERDFGNQDSREPQSALEHYERAVEREDQGNLGDSLAHYRKAYRLDARVDQKYKSKHFPPSSMISKPRNLNPSNAAVTVPNPAHHSLHGPPTSNITELINSFSSLTIPGAPPPTEGSPPPPCPISTIPSEVLVEILLRVAVIDIASYMRLAQVCKSFAYLTLTEDKIWKGICLGPEFGFSAMHYTFVCSIDGTPLLSSDDVLDTDPPSCTTRELSITTQSLPSSYPLSPIYLTYLSMFHNRPRIRFPGAYISTVNYIRPGAASQSQISWNTPVHIVTYYRYLRFFRDGTCVSLLTTDEPQDVIHHLTRENLENPYGVMKNALKGRWRLSGPDVSVPTASSSSIKSDPPSSTSDHSAREPEGLIHIETEGPGSDAKYTYVMTLALRSASNRTNASRSNKLVWRDFWSYNRLTDDWAEFGLRNDRAFLWSRVRSWGTG
jgi:F-box protein 9